jgi:hypothetical protein
MMMNTPPRTSYAWSIMMAATVFVITVFGAWTDGAAQTTGYHDFSFGSTISAPTGSKPESKLWFNDGVWWGVLFNPSLQGYDIYRLNLATQSWADTGTAVDDRAQSTADAMWDQASGKLYIVSNLHVNGAAPTNTSSNWGRLYRYTYDSATQNYIQDAGFPVTVTKGREETLTIAKDSKGELWVTYVESSKVMVNHSIGSDNVWGTPFALPVSATAKSVTSDDIASIIAFGGNKIGVFWTNQKTDRDYFAVHLDGNAETTWLAEETAWGGGVNCTGLCADDHINLKTDSTGKIYVAAKTSFTADSDPLIVLLVRSTSGTWSSSTESLHANTNTRGIVVLDESHNRLYIFVTSNESGGNILYKSTSMSNPSFVASGQGSIFIDNPTDAHLNNATSTKQNVTSNSGLLVLASDSTSHFYAHNFTLLTGPTIASFAPTSGPTGASVVLTGTNFTGASSVKFNGTTASFTVNSSTQITATVPSTATSGSISVTTSGGTGTSAASFTVTVSGSPTITSISPTSGAVGAAVTINGTNFSTATAVAFNSTQATFVINSATKITATVPAGATTGKITVTNSVGTATSASSFTVKPAISSFTPTSGHAGTTQVTINGSNLSNASSVTIAGAAAAINSNSANQILATVGAGATGSGLVVVTTPGGTTDSSNLGTPNFTVTTNGSSSPVITSFTPTGGIGGTSVTINGANFTGTTAVKFNGASTTFTFISDSQLKATVPAGATTGPISVTNASGTTDTSTLNPPNFSVTRIKDITFEAGSLIGTSGFGSTTGTVTLETGLPLKGSDSMTVSSGASYGTQSFTAADEVFISIYIKIAALPAGQVRVLRIADGGTSVGALTLETTGKVTLRNSSTSVGATTIALTPGTLYRMGIHQKRGTGSNGVLEGFVATGDANFGTAFAASSSQTFTTQADLVQCGATTGNAGSLTLDDIRLDTGIMPGPSAP